MRLDDAPIKGSLAQFLYIDWRQADDPKPYAQLLHACRNPERWPAAANVNMPNSDARKQIARIGDALRPAKPILVANRNPLAKWLNLLFLATATCHSERFHDNVLDVDPFAASLTVLDYFQLGEQ